MCPVPSPSYPTEVLDPSCRYARRSEARCRSVTAAAACWAPGQLQGGGPLRWGDSPRRWAVRALSIRLRQHCKPRAGQQPPETPTSALPSPALLLRATWRERGVESDPHGPCGEPRAEAHSRPAGHAGWKIQAGSRPAGLAG